MLIIGEKVMVKCHSYPTEQFGVDAPFPEDFVNIGTVAADFAREPGRGASLTSQLVADE